MLKIRPAQLQLLFVICMRFVSNDRNSEKNTRGLRANLPPKCPKEPPKIRKEPPEICIEFNAKQFLECYFYAGKLEK